MRTGRLAKGWGESKPGAVICDSHHHADLVLECEWADPVRFDVLVANGTIVDVVESAPENAPPYGTITIGAAVQVDPAMIVPVSPALVEDVPPAADLDADGADPQDGSESATATDF